MIRLGINHNCDLVRVVPVAEIFEAGAIAGGLPEAGGAGRAPHSGTRVR